MKRTLGVLGTLLTLACACAAVPPSHDFRIAGVAISTRDGAPVPYCRISAALVPAQQIGSARGPEGPPQRGQGPQQNGGGRPGGGGGGRQGGGQGGNRGGGKANESPQTTADASGRFTLDLPRAGAWMLTAAARGFRGQNYDEHDGFFSAVVLTEAAPTYTISFRLAPDSLLTGLIFDDAGEAVAQAQVTAELLPPPIPGVSANADAERPRPAGFALTDDRGRYEIGGLQPGRYRIRVVATPWYAANTRNGGGGIRGGEPPATVSAATQPLDPPLDFVYPTTWFPGTANEQEAQVIAVSPGEARQADFHLTAIPSIHLRVPRPETGNPQPTESGRGRQQQQVRQQVMISRVSSEGQGFEQPIPGGFVGKDWDFGGLTPGIYEVRMPGPDGRTSGEVRQIEVTAGSQTVVTLDSARPLVPVTIKIEGVADSDVPTVEFVDTETGRRITSNAPMRGRRGPDRDDNDDSPDEPRNATRNVMLPPHQYEVYVGSNANDYMTGMSSTGAKVLGRVIAVGGPAALTLRLVSGRTQVEGVARLQGKPAAGAMVLLVPMTLGQPGDLTSILRDETNTDGTFLISGVPPGRYILVAIDHGWEVDWRTPESLVKYLMHGLPIELRGGVKAHEELEAAER